MTNFRPLILVFLTLATLSAGAAELIQSKSPDQFLEQLPRDAELVVVNFWATWCIPCVAELEDFAKLDAEIGQKIVFVGVSLDDAVPDDHAAIVGRVEKMLARKKIEYLNVLYLGNPAQLTSRWNIDEGIPQTIVITRDGETLHTINGRIDTKTLREKLTRLLAQSRPKG